jgi:hypothetical protein
MTNGAGARPILCRLFFIPWHVAAAAERAKAWVTPPGLMPAPPPPGRLFTDTQPERFGPVMPLVDKLNRKYGPVHGEAGGGEPEGRVEDEGGEARPARHDAAVGRATS